MKEREFYIPSSDGKSKLRCVEWIPDEEVRAVMQLAHGMTEHIGRYRDFAVFLAEHGIYVYGNDHLGHGKTASGEEAYGYFGDKGGAACLIKDMRRLTKYGKKKYPGKKHILLGHSMGSFLTRRYLTVYEDGPDGVILLGTGAPPSAEVLFGYLLASAMCGMKGKRYRSRLLYDLSLGNYNRKFAPVSSDHDWLTRDKDRAAGFGKDEYCRFIFTAGAYRDLFSVILKTAGLEKKGKFRTDIPVLFLSGSRDPVGECTKGVRRVCRRYDKAGVKDMTVGFYEDARHEVLNETNREEVWNDILAWVDAHLDKNQPD